MRGKETSNVRESELGRETRDLHGALGAGEVFVVPQGVEHRPVAKEEAQIMIIEPTGTPNTGDAATAAKRQRA